ncbi:MULTISPECIES: hypothetical protein [Mesorhizobium]|nr:MULTISPECIES: hypothetical protein [Mesorhizobium]
MKTASIALAAILALSNTAFAAGETKHTVKIDKPVAQEQLVDTTTTGSIKSDAQTNSDRPRLGFDANPFSFGSFH